MSVVLYVKQSDNSVWGYESYTLSFNSSAFSSMTNVSAQSQITFFLSTDNDSLICSEELTLGTGNQESYYLNSDCVFSGEKSITVDSANSKTLSFQSVRGNVIAFWVKFTGSDSKLVLSGDNNLYISVIPIAYNSYILYVLLY